MLQLVIGFVHEVVKVSWELSSLTSKYFLASLLIYGFYKKEEFMDLVDSTKEIYVTSIVVLSTIFLLAGISIDYRIALVSEPVSLIYYGYLFWTY